ncbi:24124_t:CDS:1, partial [Dentiscutata erythropus]
TSVFLCKFDFNQVIILITTDIEKREEDSKLVDYQCLKLENRI